MKTDAQIQSDVICELKCEPTLSPENIGVAVHSGIVTLSGTVANYPQKVAAEKATLRVRGVKSVVEQIEVSLSLKHKQTDNDLAEAAARALSWHVWTPDNIKAKVENGWITLTGEVEYEYQRKSAHNSVRFLIGVRGVTNSITIKPHVNALNIRDSIEKALVRDAELEAGNITVIAEGGRVTLRGRVHSAWERHAATKAAWRTIGVSEVKDELEVGG
jgi:osmotically-inducible protein OsmY